MADPEITSLIDKEKAASNIDLNDETGTGNTLSRDAAHGTSSGKWPTMKELVDPKGPFIRKWNVIFIVSCVCAVLLDPLFLYIPIINEDMKCLRLDNNLKIAALVLRSLTDICYLLNISLEVYSYKNSSAIRLESLSSNNRAKEPGIAKAHSYILIDILAVLPIPQVVILNFMCKMKGSGSFSTRKLMNFLVVAQYVPRVFRIYLSCQESKKSSKEETPIWLKGLLNFFLYILASHILGAFWYFFAVQRITTCWQQSCRIENGCNPNNLDCRDHHALRNISFLDEACSIHSPNGKFFDFGIYLSILQLGILGSTNYPEKVSNCFWWGLRNLSSLGSNLQTSINTWENLFAASISIIGLLLFIYLIGNLQTYMQLETSRRETHRWNMKIHNKKEEKKEAIERWLSDNGIPLQKISVIMDKVQVELEEKRDIDVDTESIFSILPLKLQREMRSCMPLNRLKRVSLPHKIDIDERVLRALSAHLKPETYSKNDIIIEEDKPLEKMIFIVAGSVKVEMKGLNDTKERGPWQTYGEKLLTWPAWSSFPGKSNESVRAITKTVEVLVLKATDMETVCSKFRHYFGKRNLPLIEADWELLTSDLVTLLRKVPIFQRMDSQVLKEITRHLFKSSYGSDNYIVQENHPLDKLFFLVEGSSLSIESSRPCTRESLGVGDFYGEELVHWVINWSSHTSFPANVPLSTCSIKVPANPVIVGVLTFHDLKNIFCNKPMTQFMKQPPNLPMDVHQDKGSATFVPLMITWLKQVPNLQNVGQEGLKAICEEFKLMRYNDKSRDIITSGENKFDKMFLVVSGLVCIRKIKCDEYQYCYSGQHYGDHELFEWVSRISSFTDYSLPKSDLTVEAVGDVEALVLMADDLVKVASKFNLRVVGKKIGQSQTAGLDLDMQLEEIEKKLRRSMLSYGEENEKKKLSRTRLPLGRPRHRKAAVEQVYTADEEFCTTDEEQDVDEEAEEHDMMDVTPEEFKNDELGLYAADDVEMEASNSYNKRRAVDARRRQSVLKQILQAAVVLDCQEETQELHEDEMVLSESSNDIGMHTYGKSWKVKSGPSRKKSPTYGKLSGKPKPPSHVMQVLNVAYGMDMRGLDEVGSDDEQDEVGSDYEQDEVGPDDELEIR